MKKDYTHVSVLLDRSGSMQSIRTDIIGGFNSFVAEQKKAKAGDMTLSLLTFDVPPFDYVYELESIDKIVDLTEATYVPRGGTALNDAMAQLIIQTGTKLAALKEEDRPDGVLFVCISDGQENASREYSNAKLKLLVEEQTAKYNWKFLYIGANQDSQKESKDKGMTRGYNFDATHDGVAFMSRSLSADTIKYRTSKTL